MNEFKNLFVEDALALLVKLEETLLDIEKDSTNLELIQEVFRTMHTFKGVSSMYGFDNIAEYTHLLETVYNAIRSGEIALSANVLGLSLDSVDHLRNLLGDFNFSNSANIERHKALLARVHAIVEENKLLVAKQEVKKSSNVTKNEQLKTYYILFKPDESILDRGVKILPIFRELSSIGRFIILKKENDGNEDTIGMPNGWHIYLVTAESIEEIEDIFMFVIDDCRIIKISDADMFDEQKFAESDNLSEVNKEIEREAEQKRSLEAERVFLMENIEMQKPEPEIEEVTPAEFTRQPEPVKTKPNLPTNIEETAGNSAFNDFGKQVTSRISVNSEKLDNLMYLVSELVIARAEMGLITKNRDFDKLLLLEEKIDKLTKKFRDNTLSIRLVPIDDILTGFRRLVRNLSIELKKEINFIAQGTESELDKNMIDVLAEPLLHIFRNCIDHGIEPPHERIQKGKEPTGVIKLTAYHAANNIFIQIQDDGRGIDPDMIRSKAIEKGFISADAQLSKQEIYSLIFLPGFSTANVISEISGRGVGMDIVKKKINSIRGEIEIDSEVGLGTSFTIKLQQTISIIDTLMVEAADSHFLVALSEVEFCGSQSDAELFKTGNNFIEFDNTLIPYVHMRNDFELSKDETSDKHMYVIINKNSKRFAIIIDRIIGEYQAVLKPINSKLKQHEYLAGASIMGDGKLALMLNTDKLLSFSSNLKN